jgi:NADH dehydrogenase [ubiquinone] 1 alpha subcomplex assembly factor 5
MMRRTLLLLFSLFRKPYPTSSFSTTTTSKVNIFDRELKRNQRDRAAWLMPQNDPLLNTVADNLLDRLQVGTISSPNSTVFLITTTCQLLSISICL